jgi:ferredoxin
VTARIGVDESRCVGSGDCALAAPHAFEVDDDRALARVLPGAADADPAELQRAAYACPTGAIRLAEG